MAAQTVIGDNTAGAFKAYLGDGAQAAVDTYGWFFTPEAVTFSIQTKAIVKGEYPQDQNYCVQGGNWNILVTMKNILIEAVGASTAITQLNLLKEALFQWSAGYTGTDIDGKLLTFQGYDNGGNEWSRSPTYAHPTAAEFAANSYGIMTTKLVEPIPIIPLPNGNYVIRRLKFGLFRASVEAKA